MKGLFLSNFYEARNNLKVLGIVLFLAGIAVVWLGNYTALELYPYIVISMFAVSNISTLRNDVTSKWNKYELTLPVKRKDLIISKYTSYVFWTSIGAVLSAIVVISSLLIHEDLFAYGLRDCASLLSLGVGLAIITGAIFYPFAIIFGAEKSEILLTISVALSVMLAMFIIRMANSTVMIELSYGARLVIFNIIYILLYILSFFLANKLFAKKEL